MSGIVFSGMNASMTEWERMAPQERGRETPASKATLRDYFAAKAVNGFCADPSWRADPSEYAEKAYLIADAMLAAREAK